MPVADHVNLVSLTHPLKARVGVMGAGGKTTLARAIAAKLDIEFIEIDWITHMPGWQIRPEEPKYAFRSDRCSQPKPSD